MLPSRDGVGPSWVGLTPGPWPRLIDFLQARFPAVSEALWTARIERGDVLDEQGRRVSAGQAYRPHGKLCYYRSRPPEARVAGDEVVLFEDELLVVADKPHFLPVTPAGRYLQETLLVRLRRRLGIDSLVPLHRIDRETAGLVLFAKQAATRKAYHALFAQRSVAKTYQAIAAWQPQRAFPLTRASVMQAGSLFMQMCEQDGPDLGAAMPNAVTTVGWLETRAPWARYELRPLTGQRHQLRVHMAALGMPILGDRIYPTLAAEGTDDPANPLRLLAQHIEFLDPITGQVRRFESQRRLDFPLPADPV
jgi:tRNA pseudouridine32 synthase/23S rRNA pseudouridine746 synthase